jgi:hypothetical protein
MNNLKAWIISFLVVAAGFATPQTTERPAITGGEANLQFILEGDASLTIQPMGIALIILPTMLKSSENRPV